MNFPTISDYKSALLEGEETFATCENLSPVKDIYGDIFRIAGGFAVVFKMQDHQTGKHYALKCFHRPKHQLIASYRLISEYLKNYNSPYLVPYRFLEKEVWVSNEMTDENEFPVVLMDWVAGKTLREELKTAVANHDIPLLQTLSARFDELAIWLLAQPFAHTDLKTENILVTPEKKLVLVDYDGIFVPAMQGQTAREEGTPGYCHPRRTDSNFNQHSDDFTILLIALSLRILVKNPRIYTETNSDEHFLFTQSDLANLSTRPLWNTIWDLAKNEGGEIGILGSLLQIALQNKDQQIPLLPSILKTNIELSGNVSKAVVEENVFIDPRDGQRYKTVKLKDENVWMAQNFNFDVGEGCCFYDNDPKNGEKYGRLYTWEAAMKACPEGWHLPSHDEWQEMKTQYMGKFENKDKQDEARFTFMKLISGFEDAYKALIEGGSGFSVMLSGYYDSNGSFGSTGEYGRYWSSTENNSSHAWFCNFDRSSSDSLLVYYDNKSSGFSCRYIQNPPPEENVFIDPRDGQRYKTVKLKDGKVWMAQNFNFDVGEGCSFYENDPKNGGKYGRLYTWEAAMKACPPGWHLPSDTEWWEMTKQYGGTWNDKRGQEINNTDSEAGKAAYKALIESGDSGFSALLGGLRNSDGSFNYIGSISLYWGSTGFSAWSYGFFRLNSCLYRMSNIKSWCSSCRYIQNPLPEENTFIDPRDGQSYKIVKLKDGKVWMAQSLNFDVGTECCFYDDNPKNGEKYGGLYTWEGATKACPPGWRLPSDEEWEEMIRSYGEREATYKALIEGGDSGFSALFGGFYYDSFPLGTYANVGDYGNYWSSTEEDSFGAWGYRFDRSLSNLDKNSDDKSWGYSCRCIRD
jgi:uncharacterized protein (TIGR02145 family)